MKILLELHLEIHRRTLNSELLTLNSEPKLTYRLIDTLTHSLGVLASWCLGVSVTLKKKSHNRATPYLIMHYELS